MFVMRVLISTQIEARPVITCINAVIREEIKNYYAWKNKNKSRNQMDTSKPSVYSVPGTLCLAPTDKWQYKMEQILYFVEEGPMLQCCKLPTVVNCDWSYMCHLRDNSESLSFQMINSPNLAFTAH